MILRLAARADVVIENFRPDLKKRLGIGYDEVSQRNPAVIYCSISGFGQDGPYKDLPGLDNIFQGMAGLMEVTGAADGPPLKAGERLADVITGINAAFGIMVALFHRQRTGEGQFLDLALVDCLVAAQAPLVSYYFGTGQQPPRLGNGSLFSAPTNTFQTTDRPINLCIFNEKHWAKLCQALGRKDLMEDRRFKTNRLRVENAAAITDTLAQMLQGAAGGEWLERLQAGRSALRTGVYLRRNLQRSPDPTQWPAPGNSPCQLWACKRPSVCRCAFTKHRAPFAGRRRCWGSTAGKYCRRRDSTTRKSTC